jgi:hypothetical protein
MTVRELAERKCPTKSHVKKDANPEEADPSKRLTPKQRAFLEAFACGGSIRLAAEAAKVSRRNHCRWIKSDPKYAEAFEDARERAIEAMVAEARRRAVEGVQEAVYYEGKVCGHRQRYSDNLLMFLLKAARPEVYAERAQVAVEHRGQIAHQFPELAKPGQAAARATLSATRACRD